MSKRAVVLSAVLVVTAGLCASPAAHAAFPGQNGQIVFAHAKYDKRAKDFDYAAPASLFTMFPDGSGTAHLGDDPAYDDYEPAWSPDGTTLAYASVGPARYTGIYTTRPGSSELSLLTKAEYPDAPAWTPDGKSLAYVDYASGIHLVGTAEGSRPQLLLAATKRIDVAAPVFAADGRTLFFSRTRLSASGKPIAVEIWAAEPDGGNPRKVIGGSGQLRSSMEPDVSPDSKQLVFVAREHDGKPGGLWVANVDGSGLRKLAASSRSRFYTGPSWSPDGTKVVAALQRQSVKLGGAIVTIDVASGARTTLRTGRKQYMGTVSWQPVPLAPTVG